MSQCILVVEDQDDNRQILRDLLTSADFEVIEAVDGEAGLAAAAANRPDLILMTSSYRSWTATRRRAVSRPMQCCMPFLSSPSPPMDWLAMMTRPVRRV